MNYLGHLFLSNNDTELMLSNLFGDFVKGKDLSQFRAKTQEGITLHRAIDNYIDTHPAVVELLHVLYPKLPKVSGIAVDLFFDHLLAKNWDKYHTESLGTFLNAFYSGLNTENEEFTAEFKHMIYHMVKVNWISYYPQLNGLEKALNGVSSRISFSNELKNGLPVFLENQSLIESTFEIYMKDAIVHFGISNSK
jgi:acyl carrier protein phosphodiesterase